ncbi:MAG: GNAT family N-acetyltransferase [Bacteroidia bacterium]
MISIRQVNTEFERKEYYRIRYEVLRKPWNQPKQSTTDEWEDQSYHAIAVDESGNVLGAGRLQFDSETEGKIRSMAVLPEHRNKNIGTMILSHLEEIAKSRNLKKLVLDGRIEAVRFYQMNGYLITGDSYLLFGEIPHKKMEKILK